MSFVNQRRPTASMLAPQKTRVLAIPRAALSARPIRDTDLAARLHRATAAFLADRLAATTARLGYSSPDQDRETDAIEDALMDETLMATIHFDILLRYFIDKQSVNSFANLQL